MPYRKRPRTEPTDEWFQLGLQLAWPEQVSYELIRPVVLFGFSPAERLAIVRLHTEGWSITSIAGYLRPTAPVSIRR